MLLLSFIAALSPSCAVDQRDATVGQCGAADCSYSSSESGGNLETSTGATTSMGSSDSSNSGILSTTSGENGSGSSGSESSTGTPLPVCGDGVVEGDETCDDGNDVQDDGCRECAKDSIVFISSEIYQGFALGGLYGADLRCQSLAAMAGLQRFLTYRAWLSTPTISVSDRLLHSRGRYVLVNGLVVAQNWEGLISGSIETTINVDEFSQTQDIPVWTGTLASGQPALGSEFCEDWEDDSGLLKFGGAGLSDSIDAAWSFFDHAPCDTELRLYCVEQ